MAKYTAGWYRFADGYEVWRNGMSGTEKRLLVREHGALVCFIAD